MESNKILKIIILVLLIVIVGFLLKGKINLDFLKKSDKTTEAQQSISSAFSLPENPSFANDCKAFTGYSVEDYYEGWKRIFKKQNKLSDEEYSKFVHVSSFRLMQRGEGCALSLNYTITRDWFNVNNWKELIPLGTSSILSPDELPAKRTPDTVEGVSLINLKDKLVFESKDDAVKFYLNKHPHFKQASDTILFSSENVLQPAVYFADISLENKCFKGVLILTTAQTIYDEYFDEELCVHPQNIDPNF